MNKVFVVKNQHGLYLSKQQEWVSGTESQSLYRTAHRDEAINTVFEVSSRDIYLRAEAVACAVDAKNNPVVAEDFANGPSGQSELPIDTDTETPPPPEDDAAQSDDTEASGYDEAPGPAQQALDIETPPASPHLSER